MSRQPVVWRCEGCGKLAVWPYKKKWVRCNCGEDILLKPFMVLDGQLAVYNEIEEVMRRAKRRK